ncbi:hypothetical protein EV192_101858 [Actinocrispum wychmicini]|uniref:Peptidase S9 prolyl oligopeptidase catalytic domain-containing protein n=1 Tax=Actinocrispum wychmicini TaxID=1213861 RepID=A0A4R2JYS5_9PSEU|nr:hypothetical protein EV192_101858 [Actinocrispum wychmicini]
MLLKSKLAGLVAGPLLAMAPPVAAADDITNTDVSYQNLHGTIVAPANGTGHPGMVLLAGAGARGRDAYRPEAEAFARAGIVVLIYDKRSDYSRATSSFTTLADDAIAGVELLRTRPDVTPSRVGLWGHSQGGWVAPLAATKSADIAFVVTASASALPADRTQLWSDRTYLAHAGISGALVGPIGLNASRMLVAAGLFGDTAYEPTAVLQRVRQPLLGVFADHDRSTAPGESLALFRESLDRGGNQHYTLRVVKDANHNMRRSADGFNKAAATEFAPGFVDLVTTWVNGLAAGPPSASADPPPAQPLASSPTEPLAWYEGLVVQLGLFAVMLVGFLAYPVCAAVRRLRRTTHRPPGRWPARLTALAGLIAVFGTFGYLFSVVSTGAVDVDTAVLGRPPTWLLLQLVAVGVVVGAGFAVRGWRHARVQRGLLLAGVAAFLPWAVYWGLFTV